MEPVDKAEQVYLHLEIVKLSLELIPLVRENDIDNDGLHDMAVRHRRLATGLSETAWPSVSTHTHSQYRYGD